MKFLHTADWQLGMNYRRLADKGSELRKARLQTVRRMFERATEETIDFVVVAGDLFEGNGVESKLLREVKNIFEEFSAFPIYILPGNHDPLTQDSIYNIRDVFKPESLPRHVHILMEEKPVPLPNEIGTFYPCPVRARKSSSAPTAWIPKRDRKDELRIGIAHGSWQVIPSLPVDDHPIPADAVDRHQLDYLALGHWHSVFPNPPLESGNIQYCGTPETTAFDEKDSGNALIVEIEEPGAIPMVKAQRVGQYDWLEWEVTFSDQASMQSLVDKVGQIESPQKTLLRLNVNGVAELGVFSRLDELKEEIARKVFFVDFQEKQLVMEPTDIELESFAPSGWPEGAAKRLKEYIEGKCQVPPEGMEVSPSPDVARRALALMYRMIKNI